MALRFVDESDTEGRISEDITVEYDGSENVDEYLERLLQEDMEYEDAAEEIILEMVHDLSIQEVRRED